MRAMILAAGRGKRMAELTKTTPKPLLTVAGKALIVHNIERLVAAGIRDIVINVAYCGDQIRDALGDGKQFSANITYSPEPEGGYEVAGGIINALPLLGPEAFITVNADLWSDYDCQHLASMQTTGAHLVLVDNPDHNVDGDFYYADGFCVEDGDLRLTFSGIAMFSPSFFDGAGRGFLALRPLLDQAIANNQVSAEYYQGTWIDVGTPARLAQTQSFATKNLL